MSSSTAPTTGNAPPASRSAWRNADVAWDSWPVDTYLSENYRQIHRCDDAVMVHHSALYCELEPDSIGLSLELGAGPNLYPLMLAGAACRRVHAVDHSEANVAYLQRQLGEGPDPSWLPFFQRCRDLNPALPRGLTTALSRVEVTRGDVRDLAAHDYGLASMNFVAESISEDLAEVTAFCATFVRSVHPGGYLVAAFMENQARYRLGDGSSWPGCPIDGNDVETIFSPVVEDLRVSRIDADPSLPDYYGGYTGMVLLRARRRCD